MGDTVINGGREAVKRGIQRNGYEGDGGRRYFGRKTVEQVGFHEIGKGSYIIGWTMSTRVLGSRDSRNIVP